MAPTFLLATMLTLLVGSGLGYDGVLPAYEKELQDTETNYVDMADEDELGVNADLTFSDGKAFCPSNTRKCRRIRGNCQPQGTCPEKSVAKKCGRQGCDCCVPYPTRCHLQMNPGQGVDPQSRYYFDVHLGQCRHFDWYGSGGNANRFITYEDCQRICGHNPNEDIPAPIGNSTFLEFAHKQRICDNNFINWKSTPNNALSYIDAENWCNINGQRLACPLSTASFLKWRQGQDPKLFFWFAGQQGTGIHQHSYFWANNEPIPNYVKINGIQVNTWDPGYPSFNVNGIYCVKGSRRLETDDCSKLLSFYCSP